MNYNDIFQKFCRNRNIKSSTKKGYDSALRLYENFQGKSIEDLFAEARLEEMKESLLKIEK